jgi:hypothetical protein
MDFVVPELAKAMYEERVRDAMKARRFSSPSMSAGLPSVLRSLLHVLHRS